MIVAILLDGPLLLGSAALRRPPRRNVTATGLHLNFAMPIANASPCSDVDVKQARQAAGAEPRRGVKRINAATCSWHPRCHIIRLSPHGPTLPSNVLVAA